MWHGWKNSLFSKARKIAGDGRVKPDHDGDSELALLYDYSATFDPTPCAAIPRLAVHSYTHDPTAGEPGLSSPPPLPEDFRLEDHVGFLLRKAHQRHASLFVDVSAEHALTPTQFAALQKVVELGKVTQNHLGRQVAMDPATIQGVIRRLTLRGLIVRTHDPMDRRTAVLAPTEEAYALIATAVACAQRAHAKALSPLSPEEQAAFLALLRKMG